MCPAQESLGNVRVATRSRRPAVPQARQGTSERQDFAAEWPGSAAEWPGSAAGGGVRQGAEQLVLVGTKLHPPPVREETIGRERLVACLRSGSDRRLTLVACPAGFGKTTLLAAWREAEAARKPVGWLTLDEGDNDPVVLWSYVIEALRRASPAVAGAVPARPVAAPKAAGSASTERITHRAPSAGAAAQAGLPRCLRPAGARTCGPGPARPQSPLGESCRQVMTGRLPECEARRHGQPRGARPQVPACPSRGAGRFVRIPV